MSNRKFKQTYNYLEDVAKKYDYDINQLTDAELLDLARCYKKDTGRNKIDYMDIEGVLSSVRFNHYWDDDRMYEPDEHLIADNRMRARDLNNFNGSW